jgi:hypothetical protein
MISRSQAAQSSRVINDVEIKNGLLFNSIIILSVTCVFCLELGLEASPLQLQRLMFCWYSNRRLFHNTYFSSNRVRVASSIHRYSTVALARQSLQLSNLYWTRLGRTLFVARIVMGHSECPDPTRTSSFTSKAAQKTKRLLMKAKGQGPSTS